MEQLNYPELIESALAVRQNAYTPYSNYKVGAALLAASGQIYVGCNVENASYGATICAERAAVVQAISAGEHEFTALAIVGYAEDQRDANDTFAYPCGICRQVLSEFCHPDMPIVIARSTSDYRLSSMSALLPESFGPQHLK